MSGEHQLQQDLSEGLSFGDLGVGNEISPQI